MTESWIFTKEVEYSLKSKWHGRVYFGKGIDGSELCTKGCCSINGYYLDHHSTYFFSFSRERLEKRMDKAIRKYVKLQESKVYEKIEVIA